MPLASAADYDHGDAIATTGTYGSMQIHNIAVPQTIFAYNRWGAATIEDVGIGNAPGLNTDWTFSANALSWQFRRLLVLVLTDSNHNGLPDAWERRHFGSLTAPLGPRRRLRPRRLHQPPGAARRHRSRRQHRFPVRLLSREGGGRLPHPLPHRTRPHLPRRVQGRVDRPRLTLLTTIEGTGATPKSPTPPPPCSTAATTASPQRPERDLPGRGGCGCGEGSMRNAGRLERWGILRSHQLGDPWSSPA
ncbi:MAG: hypothetical protein U1F87_09330 [Kiritimatiellia bacterium]